MKIDVNAAQEEDDGVDAAAKQYVARLISSQTKKIKKVDWQVRSRRMKRQHKSASSLIALISIQCRLAVAKCKPLRGQSIVVATPFLVDMKPLMDTSVTQVIR